MIALVNLPLPVPSLVNELEMVGFGDVDQQTPFADIVPPPVLVINPPLTAEFDVTEVITSVVSVGKSMDVVKFNCCPYDVPNSFMANDLT